MPKPRPITGKVRNPITGLVGRPSMEKMPQQPISPKPDLAKGGAGRPSPKRSSEIANAKPSRLNQRNSEAGPSSGDNDPKRVNPYKPMFNDFKNPYVGGANGAQSDRHEVDRGLANASPKRGNKVYEKPWMQNKANVQERPLGNARGSESALKNVIEDKYVSA